MKVNFCPNGVFQFTSLGEKSIIFCRWSKAHPLTQSNQIEFKNSAWIKLAFKFDMFRYNEVNPKLTSENPL